MKNILFRECPKCHSYGILDSGKSCKFCNGSGEIMFDKETGKRITLKMFARKYIKENNI